MKKIILILLILTPTFTFSKKVINSGHQTPIKFLEYQEKSDAFFSLSEDGTLVIKRRKEDKIYKRFFITSNTVFQMKLSPVNSHLALVEGEDDGNFIISMWNWETEKKLYSINLSDFPMDIGFTGGGNYIFTTAIADRPIRVYNAKTGAASSKLNKITGFTDFIYIGSSEKYAYLYSSSGKLEIRNVADSKLLKSIVTERSLSNLQITPDKKYILAKRADELLLIGRLDGIVYDTVKIPELTLFHLNPLNGEVVCYTNNKYRKTLSSFQIVGGEFYKNDTKDVVVKHDVQKLITAGNSILLADESGNLEIRDTWSGDTDNFLKNDIININDISLTEDKAIITTESSIYIFTSPFFSDKSKNSKRLLSYSIEQLKAPIKSAHGSMVLNENLLLWSSIFTSYNLTEQKSNFTVEMSAQIIDVKVKDDKILILDKNGYVKLIDAHRGRVSFDFKSPGFTSIAFNGENEIIGGTDSTQGSSLMVVDLQTKETLPMKFSLDVVFDIIPGNKSYITYFSGFKKTDNQYQTQLVEYNTLTKQERILLKNQSEIFDVSFDIDDKTSIYTNLGSLSLLKIDSMTKRVKPFQITTNQTNSIKYSNSGVYTVNANHSLSIWNPTTGKKIIDLYLFIDNEWVAISQDSVTAFGSINSAQYITSN